MAMYVLRVLEGNSLTSLPYTVFETLDTLLIT